MTRRTMVVTCHGCNARQTQWLDQILVTQRADGSLLLMFPCEACLSGSQAVTHPAPRAAVLFSGAGVRRPGQTGWPPMAVLPPSRTGPRTVPPSLLARMVQRRNKPQGRS